MIDVTQTIEKYKGHKDYRCLVRINKLYRCLKLCKPHPFDYDWRETLAEGRGSIDYYPSDGALSYLVFLSRFKMDMREGDYISAVGQIEEMIELGLDVLREDIYTATINTIEGELCCLENNLLRNGDLSC